jgi:drug/metabolite transporter (DMT)-like permease
VGTRLVWGPWRFSPAAGITINILACLYLILVLFFSFWPPYTPITPKDMNYSSVLLVAVLLFSVGYYFTFARKAYDGPIVETELVVDGVISSSK